MPGDIHWSLRSFGCHQPCCRAGRTTSGGRTSPGRTRSQRKRGGDRKEGIFMFKVTSCNITLCVTHTKLHELNPTGSWWVSPKQVRLKDMEGCASVVLFFFFVITSGKSVYMPLPFQVFKNWFKQIV